MNQMKFKEQQRFRGLEIFALIAFFAIGLTYRFIDQHFINPTENTPLTLPLFLFALSILGLALAYFVSIKMTTKINDKGIHFKYSPWQTEKRKIEWNEIVHWEIIDLPRVAEYSGWAVQFRGPNSYSLSGSRGLKLELKNGESIFIGSRKLTALRELMGKKAA